MMDKAKAYDEALERARKQRDDYQKELDKTDKNSQLAAILRGGISAIELAFPELTESEDEKIRKSLIDFLTDIKEISESGRSVWAVRKEDAEMCKSSIAYLEKQKEQKSVEWSKKDEKIIKTIIDVLERDGQITVYEQRGGTMSASVGYSNKYEEEIAWLKDISLNHKKFIEAVDKLCSNEWSKEDEAIMTCIVCCLDGQFVSEAARKQCLEWFNKHRRDFLNRPSWKPTKEHIDAIEECLEFYAESTDTYRHLKSLLSELVKL